MSDSSAKVALITGAGGGLGGALVGAFAEAGWQVIAAFRQKAPASAAPDILPVLLDVTQTGSPESVVRDALARCQRIDALINNAGVAADALLAQLSEADWDQVMAVNLKGAFACARAVARPMMRQRDGHIINISSFAGRSGARGQANYAAAKAGLIGLTQSLARELGPLNVRVNAVLPGVLPTKITAGLSAEQMESFAEANALGRINSLDEVARFIVFLAGTQNISGQVFQLDSRIAAWT